MGIVKTDVPMTAALCSQTIDALAEVYPCCRQEVLTKTAFGRPMKALVIGSGERKVLFTAAHHGNEWITAPLLLKFIEELAEGITVGGKLWGVDARTIQKAATIHTVAMVDPDGVDLVTGGIAPGTLEYASAESLAARYPGIPFPDGWKANLLCVDLYLQYPAGWLMAREIKFAAGYTRPGPRDYVGRAPLSQRESKALAE